MTSRWRYNASLPIHVHLPGLSVALPHPLSASWTAALPLLKHLAEMDSHPNDLMRAALSAYLAQDLWEALEHYEEAADLGGTSSAGECSLHIRRSEEEILRRE